MDTVPKHNCIPIQPIEKERGWLWQNGNKVKTPDAPVLKTAVLPVFKIREK